MIKIDIVTKDEYVFDFNIKNLSKKVACEIFNEKNIMYDFSIGLYIVSKEKIRSLNKKLRNVDKITDVLSFPNINFSKPCDFKKYIKKNIIDVSIIDFNTNTIFLGDVVICYDVLIMQSKKYIHSIKREFSFLFTHSILHLLGYDHIKKSDEDKMFKLQDLILDRLNIVR